MINSTESNRTKNIGVQQEHHTAKKQSYNNLVS